jgi:hypothetical protein
MEQKQSEKSMMPDDQLVQFTPHEIRSLVAYLQAGGQTPMLATPDNVGTFFNGENLAGWVGDAKLWSSKMAKSSARPTASRRTNS